MTPPLPCQGTPGERGYTIVEMLVVMVVMGVIMSAVSTAFIYMTRAAERGNQELTTQNLNRTGLERVSRLLRQAVPEAGRKIAFDRAESDRVIFYADVDDDGTPDRVRLDFDGREFAQQIAPCTGSPCSYADWSTIPATPVVPEAVVNDLLDEGECAGETSDKPVLTYYERSEPNGELTELSAPVEPSLLGRIATIGIDLYVHEDAGKTACRRLSTRVHIRNWRG